ncbi:MAG: DUF3299 domain-containing protein [Planctomycetota bacterium]|nr:DUF3299 domain-containing protein [Planctomycetota bacterium]
MNVTTHVRRIVVVLGGFGFLAGCSVSFTSFEPTAEVSKPHEVVSETSAGTNGEVTSPEEKNSLPEVEGTASPAPQGNLSDTQKTVVLETIPASTTLVTPPATATRGAGNAAIPATFVPKAISDDPSQPIDLTFDDIKFDMEKGVPFQRKFLRPDIERYQDRKITIRGYILPGFQERGITQFVLVRDNMECCFGPGAALYDCILVTMAKGTVNYTVRPVTVEGTFSIEPFEGPGGVIFAIYRLQGDRAE